MPCLIPFFAFIIICMPIQFGAYASDYEEQHFKDCTPFKCGHIHDIKYPFRLRSNQPDYCGRPGFEVECVKEKLIMAMESIKYTVKKIEREDQILEIARMDSLSDLCPDKYINTTIDPSLFDYVGPYATLYYDCNASQIDYPVKFSCNKTIGSMYGYVLFDANDGDKQRLLSERCNYNISVPFPFPEFMHDGRPVLQPPSPEKMYEIIIQAGFEVRWKVDMQQCWNCTSSGGTCGHNATHDEFSCFCPEGVQQKTCPLSGEFPFLTASESRTRSNFLTT